MFSVTQRIKQTHQPKGGYIKPSAFTVTPIDDGASLHPDENIHSSLVGLTVDYLTRYSLGTPAEQAFNISLAGAFMADASEAQRAKKLLKGISGLDDRSIISTCKLSGYDVWFRACGIGYRPVQEIEPDLHTIDNIRTMVGRSMAFAAAYGPITKDGFTFEGGYTPIVSTGDGDFCTQDTLWDFKVSKNKPTKDHTLQCLMYYLMGRRSIHPEFQTIQYLGLFNPRLNHVYRLKVSDIDPDVMEQVACEVIGYPDFEYSDLF